MVRKKATTLIPGLADTKPYQTNENELLRNEFKSPCSRNICGANYGICLSWKNVLKIISLGYSLNLTWNLPFYDTVHKIQQTHLQWTEERALHFLLLIKGNYLKNFLSWSRSFNFCINLETSSTSHETKKCCHCSKDFITATVWFCNYLKNQWKVMRSKRCPPSLTQWPVA